MDDQPPRYTTTITEGNTNLAYTDSEERINNSSNPEPSKESFSIQEYGDKDPTTPGKDVLDVSEMSDAEIKREKNLIFKNIILISFAFLLNFNAFQGLSRLQSSLHKDEGMGVINQSVLYACLMVSCFILPKLLVNLIGHKWTIPLSFGGYIAWMAANGYAVWGTMVTASILVGVFAAPLWTAQCSYFTVVGARYAHLSKETEEAIVTRFFGIFFCFFQLSSITGAAISSAVLTPEDPDYAADEWMLQYCGRNDCPDNNVTESGLNNPTETTVWIMVGIYIAIAVLAVLLVCIFVDPLPDRYVKREKVRPSDILNLVLATAKHLRHKEQLVLIPLTMYSGFEQAYYAAEFSASFVTCTVGIWKVGMVTLGFGAVNAVVSLTSGRVAKYTGRLPIFTAGLIVDLASQITLMNWMPHPREEYALYIVACMWGFTDGIWQTQINGMYGVIFAKESEAAFSNYRMWESLGFIIAFAYSSFLCTAEKTYIVTAVLCVGYLGFLYVEYGQYKLKKRLVEIAPK